MSEPVISVQNLSKLYRIGATENSNKIFREAIIDGLTAPLRNFRQELLAIFTSIGSKP